MEIRQISALRNLKWSTKWNAAHLGKLSVVPFRVRAMAAQTTHLH